MKKIYLLSVFSIILTLFLPQIDAQDLTKWNSGFYYSEDTSLRFHLFVPESYDGLNSLPMVLYLHGLNESTIEEPDRPLSSNGPQFWIDSQTQSKYPCFVLVPINIEGWVKEIEPGIWGTYHPIIELIDSLSKEYKVDSNRIYINGMSAGGVGTYWYIEENPEYFAAAMSGMGSFGIPNKMRVEGIKHIPVWHQHGEKDNLIPPFWPRLLFDFYDSIGLPVVYPALQKYIKPNITEDIKQNIISDDIDYIYTEYRGRGHTMYEITYTDPMVSEWLFSKRKRTHGIVKISNKSSYGKIDSSHLVAIDCDIDSMDIAVQYSNDLGYSWMKVGEYPSSMDSISINTQLWSDSPKGIIRVQLIDKEKNIIGTDYSGYFKVDNEENCIPWLRYYVSSMAEMDPDTFLGVSTIEYMLNINDAENNTLDLSIYQKHADSISYQFVRSEVLPASLFDQSVIVNFDTLAYGLSRLKFTLTDGENSVSDSTELFFNPNNAPTSNRSISSNKYDLKIFPNPANDLLTIETDHPDCHSIEIISLTGQLIYKEEMEGTTKQIDMTPFSKGVYFVTVRSKEGVRTEKVVKL